MKRLLLIWLSVGISTYVFPQNPREIDSLRKEFNKVDVDEDWKRTEVASRLGWLFYVNSKPDSALRYYKIALAIPYQNFKVSWIANVHAGLGSSFLALNKNDSAIAHYKISLMLFRSLNDGEGIATACGNMSIAYKNLGLYEESLSSAFSALSILEPKGVSYSLASCFNSIGAIYLRVSDYDNAFLYYQKSLAVRIKINQPSEIAKSYNNLGELFILTRQYDSARINLNRAAELKYKLNDRKGLARTINNLGKVSMLTGNLQEASKEFNQSLSIQRTIDDPNGLTEVLDNLGELSVVTRDYAKSRALLLEAEAIIRLAGTPEYLRQNLELQVKLARQQKDFSNGMKLMDELLVIRDSLLNEDKSKSLQAMHIRYETDKKEQQIALFQQQEDIDRVKIRNSRIMIGALIGGLVLVVAIGGLIYINLRNARAAKARIELLLAETRHRIKNNLQTLASIFHLQTRHYTDHEMVLEARSSESRVHAMSMLHERFYNAEADHIVSTRAYITDLVHKLIDIYGVHAHDLRLSLHVDEIELDVDKALALSLIIQELVCNSFKYAFDHKPDPQLTISIRLHGDHVAATVRDNGIGLNNQSIGRSHGLSLVDALVAQLDGSMQHETSHGTTFIIQFPTTQWKKRLFS